MSTPTSSTDYLTERDIAEALGTTVEWVLSEYRRQRQRRGLKMPPRGDTVTLKVPRALMARWRTWFAEADPPAPRIKVTYPSRAAAPAAARTPASLTDLEVRTVPPKLTADELAARARTKPSHVDQVKARKERGERVSAGDMLAAQVRDNEERAAEERATWPKNVVGQPVAPPSDLEAARAQAKASARAAREKVSITPRSPYGGPDAPYSYFQDVVRKDHHRDPAAVQRMQDHVASLKEERAVGTPTLGSVVIGSSGLPIWIAEAFAAAARSAAPLFAALDAQEMPTQGVSVPVSKVTAAGTAAVHSENTSVALGGLTVTLDAEPVCEIASGYQYSFQSHDRGGAEFDRTVALDLAGQFFALLEAQLFQGTGSGSPAQMRGLGAMTAGTNVTVSGQTFANQLSAVWNTYQQTALALGAQPDLTIVAERRLAWWQAQSPNVQISNIFPGTLVASPGASLTLGAGTEDWVFIAARSAIPVFGDFVRNGPKLRINGHANVTTLTADVEVYGYAALASNRRPEGVGIVKGITAAGTTF